jgi:hypothetical protein
MSTHKTIGKCKLDLTVRGCVDCGTQWSSGWEVAKRLEVTVDGSLFYVCVNRCAECSNQRPGQPTLFEIESRGELWLDQLNRL